MQFTDLRDFIRQLEQLGELKRIANEVNPNLEVTEICDRTLRAKGPALLFERVKGSATCSVPQGEWRWGWVRTPLMPCGRSGDCWPF